MTDRPYLGGLVESQPALDRLERRGRPLARFRNTPVGEAAIWTSGKPSEVLTSASSSSTSLTGCPVATIAAPR